MPKKFEDMTLEEKKEAFNKWQASRLKASTNPAEFLIDVITEALNPYIAAVDQDDAEEVLREALGEAFTTIEEARE